MELLLGDECRQFWESLAEPPATALLPHPYKWSEKVAESLSQWLGAPVPWFPHARLLKERPNFWAEPYWFAGAYYVLEPSVLAVGHILSQLVRKEQKVRIVDLCAAPGGKTLQALHVLALAEAQGVVVAVERNNSRLSALRENAVRWASEHLIVVKADSTTLADTLAEKFDIAVVDVPCSAEGLIRRDPSVLQKTPPPARLLPLQRQLLLAGIAMVRSGGYVIYSTCTWNPLENECLVSQVADEQGIAFEEADISIGNGWTRGVEEWNGHTCQVRGWRSYPHRTGGEGFFVCVLRKTNKHRYKSIKNHTHPRLKHSTQWQEQGKTITGKQSVTLVRYGKGIHALGEQTYLLLKEVGKKLPIVLAGVCLWTDRKRQEPAPESACWWFLSPVATLQLSRKEALEFLRGSIPESASRAGDNHDWILCTYGGLGLGWLKRTGSSLKNKLPRWLRLRRTLPSTLFSAILTLGGMGQAQPYSPSLFYSTSLCPSAEACATGSPLAIEKHTPASSLWAAIPPHTLTAVDFSYSVLPAGWFALHAGANLKKLKGSSLHAIAINYGVQHYTTLTGEDHGRFWAGEWAILASWAKYSSERISYSFYTGIATSHIGWWMAVALVAGASLHYQDTPRGWEALVALRDIGLIIDRYVSEKEAHLPTNALVSVAYRLRSTPLRLYLSLWYLNRWLITTDGELRWQFKDTTSYVVSRKFDWQVHNALRHLKVGASVTLAHGRLTLHSGYNLMVRYTLLPHTVGGGLTGFSVGFRYQHRKLTLAYAYNLWTPTSGTHTLTLTVSSLSSALHF